MGPVPIAPATGCAGHRIREVSLYADVPRCRYHREKAVLYQASENIYTVDYDPYLLGLPVPLVVGHALVPALPGHHPS